MGIGDAIEYQKKRRMIQPFDMTKQEGFIMQGARTAYGHNPLVIFPVYHGIELGAGHGLNGYALALGQFQHFIQALVGASLQAVQFEHSLRRAFQQRLHRMQAKYPLFLTHLRIPFLLASGTYHSQVFKPAVISSF